MKPLVRLLVATCLISSLSLPCLSSAATVTGFSSDLFVGTATAPADYSWNAGGVSYQAAGLAGTVDFGTLNSQKNFYTFNLDGAGKDQLIAATGLLGSGCFGWLATAKSNPWATVNLRSGRMAVLLNSKAIGFTEQGERLLSSAEREALGAYLGTLNAAKVKTLSETFRVRVNGQYQSLGIWRASFAQTDNAHAETALAFARK